MLKWTKSHGCNCHPVPEGCERYHIDVGDIYSGTVESKIDDKTGELYWEASYFVLGEKAGGMSMGGTTRDTGMEFVENRITAAITSFMSAHHHPNRRIFDSLVQFDGKGHAFQEELV